MSTDDKIAAAALDLAAIEAAHESDKLESAPPPVLVRWRQAQEHRAWLLAALKEERARAADVPSLKRSLSASLLEEDRYAEEVRALRRELAEERAARAAERAEWQKAERVQVDEAARLRSAIDAAEREPAHCHRDCGPLVAMRKALRPVGTLASIPPDACDGEPRPGER